MALNVLDSNGLSYFWGKIKSRLLPSTQSTDSGKIAKVDANGSWALAASSDFKGDTGVGISSATIDNSYHLILTKTDNKTVDAGYCRGTQGEPGADYVLTNADKSDIATLTLALLQAAENGSY